MKDEPWWPLVWVVNVDNSSSGIPGVGSLAPRAEIKLPNRQYYSLIDRTKDFQCWEPLRGKYCLYPKTKYGTTPVVPILADTILEVRCYLQGKAEETP